jgi:pimeloyl-ACP methyl ester carboxylesterase
MNLAVVSGPKSMATQQYVVTSADGTRIAFERLGDGAPLIVIGGATCDRARMRDVSERFARDRAVINYDRRGRGGSGDTQPYSVEREVEDIAALIEEAGGDASLYGHSSGAGLALHAAAHGLPIDGLVLHEPPYSPDRDEDRREARRYGEQLRALLAEGRRGDAVELFFTAVGMPTEMIGEMRRGPGWAALEALAPTLAYDSEVMGDVATGGAVPDELAGRVTAPTLVIAGGAGPEWMIEVGRDVANAVKDGELRVLEDQEHVVPPDVLAPVVEEFLARAAARG